ncbi:unnamed protein product [Camellia sinensis]
MSINLIQNLRLLLLLTLASGLLLVIVHYSSSSDPSPSLSSSSSSWWGGSSSATTTSSTSTEWRSAQATYYAAVDPRDAVGGACRYNDLVKGGYGMSTTGLSSTVFERGQICGACFEVRCEQAIARAHHINQKREVKVIYIEAVVDKISSNQKDDEYRSGGVVDLLGVGVGLLLALLCVAAEASTRRWVDSFGVLSDVASYRSTRANRQGERGGFFGSKSRADDSELGFGSRF